MQNHLRDRQQLNELISGWMHRDWGNMPRWLAA